MPFVSNPGSGGATFETRVDENGYEWVPSVVSYVTHMSTGEEDPDVLQYVDATHGLPVAVVGTVALAADQDLDTINSVGEVVSITNPVDVRNDTAANFLATVSLASAQTLANVTTVGTITNPVTVAQGTAANLNATVSIAAAQTLATVTNVGTVTTLTGITNAVTVAQATAANLKATVNIASAQTLDTVTTVGTVTTITNPVGLAAGTNLIGRVSASRESGTIYIGSTAVTPKYVTFSVSSSGDNQILAGVSGKQIRILRWACSTNSTVNIRWRSGTTGISGLRYMTQFKDSGGGECLSGHFQTAANTALNLNLSAAVTVEGELTYIEV